jgi:hypothetical protein
MNPGMSVASQPALSRGRVIARYAGLIALAIALLLGPLILRTWIDGRAELRLAQAAAEADDLDAQILHLGRAARWRLPLADHDDEARAQLREIGTTASEAGDLRHALAAWRELRGALLGTRAIDVADPEQLRAANAAIVQLMIREADATGDPSGSPEHDRWAAEHVQDVGPRWRSLLASAWFAAWLFACGGFFVFGIEAKGRLEPRPALRWGASAIVLLIAWIALM